MRTSYELPCSCGAAAVVDPGQAGQAIVCAGCGARLTVPTLLEMRRLKPIAVDDEATRPAEWSPLQSALFGLGAIVCFAAIAASIYYSLQWLQVVDTERPDMRGITWRTDYDKLTPVEALDTWYTFNVDLPLLPKPYWLQQRELADHFRLIVLSAIGVALLGAALAGSAYLIPAAAAGRRP